MDEGNFHGFDYNRDKHCVDGSISKGKYRVLLKLHYLLIPNNVSNNFVENIVRNINVFWTKATRNAMNMSNNPKTIYEHIVANIINYSTVLFNNVYIICIILIVILLVFTISSIS